MPLCRVDPREWGRDAGLTLHEAAGPSCARPLCAFCWACGDAGSWLDLHLPDETTLDLRHLLRSQSRLQALFPFPSGRSCGSFFCTHSHTYMRKRGEPRHGHCRPTGPREPGVASPPRPERRRCRDRVRGRACPARRWHRLCPDPDFEIVAESRAVCRRRRPESAAHRAVAPGLASGQRASPPGSRCRSAQSRRGSPCLHGAPRPFPAARPPAPGNRPPVLRRCDPVLVRTPSAGQACRTRAALQTPGPTRTRPGAAGVLRCGSRLRAPTGGAPVCLVAEVPRRLRARASTPQAPGVRILGQVLVARLFFPETANLFSEWLCHFYVPTSGQLLPL